MVIETLSKCQQLAQCPLIDCPQALQRDESLLNCPERLESSERHQKTAIALGRSGPCRSLDGPPWHFWRSALANDNGHAWKFMAGASGRRLLSEVRRLPAKSRTRTSDVGNRWSSSSSSPGESGFRSALMGSAVLVASFEWDDSEPLEDSTAVLVHGSFFRDRLGGKSRHAALAA